MPLLCAPVRSAPEHPGFSAHALPALREEGGPLDQRGAGFPFKGSGFYATDYRSKPYQEAAKKAKDQEGSAPAPLAASAPSKDGAGQKSEA